MRMSDARGILLEDLEARRICADSSVKLFGQKDPRKLDTTKRLALARSMRKEFRISFRQLSTLVYLPESEIRKYVR